MLRRIFSYMKEYKKYAWLALICIGVEVVLEIMVPKLMADLIDIGVTNSDVPYIIRNASIWTKSGNADICNDSGIPD